MTYDGLDGTALAARVDTPALVLRDTVTSTLDVVHELAAGGAPAGTTVLADRQTRGRGRQGRGWHSPPGQGIWLGYLLRPPRETGAGLLAIRAGLAVAAALETVGGDPRLKWPNDVLLAGRKVAGILGEARWRDTEPAWVALGIGINVVGPLPDEIRDVAVPLDAVCPATRVAVLEALLPGLHRLSVAPRLSTDELAAWAARDALRGRRLAAPAAGVAEGVAPDGALRVRDGDRVHRVLAGHVVPA